MNIALPDVIISKQVCVMYPPNALLSLKTRATHADCRQTLTYLNAPPFEHRNEYLNLVFDAVCVCLVLYVMVICLRGGKGNDRPCLYYLISSSKL